MSQEQVLKDKIVAAIKTVYDPEIPVDIYELGLIYDIQILPPLNKVHIVMTLTSPACPSAGEIPGELQQAVSKVEEVSEVEVELTWEPPYTQEMMSEQAKLELGFL